MIQERMEVWRLTLRESFRSWLTLLALLSAGRLYFFLAFLPTEATKAPPLHETLYVFLMAMRYDLSIASLFWMAPLGFGVVFVGFPRLQPRSWKLWLRIWAWWLYFLSAFWTLVGHYFFYYYQDHFNVFFWEFWREWENSKLVIWSVFDEIPVGQAFLALSLLLLGAGTVDHLAGNNLPPRASGFWGQRPWALALWGLLGLLGVRGTLERPLPIQYARGVLTSYAHLNFTHSNAFYALYFSWTKTIESSAALENQMSTFPSRSEVQQAAQQYAALDARRQVHVPQSGPITLNYQVPALGSAYLERLPKHIVLIFMEGYARWPMAIEEDHFGQKIASQALRLENESIFFENYFPAGSGTIQNIVKAILGIPTPKEFPLDLTFAEAFKPFPDSLPRVMQRLGFQPRFYYGGSLNWHHLYYFLEKAGFAETYGEHSVMNVQKTRFGLYDGDLFRFVHQKLNESSGPTFDFIMTLSHHPPYELPPDYTPPSLAIPPHLMERVENQQSFLKRFEAFAYADQMLGEFLAQAQASPYFDETLFVITGDHSIWGPIQWEDHERYPLLKIPLMLYAPKLLKVPPQRLEVRGTHLDLLPTLVSLLTEKPISLVNWGRSLLAPEPRRELYGFYFDCLEAMCFMFKPYRLRSSQQWQLCQEPACQSGVEALQQQRRAFDISGLHYFFQFQKTAPPPERSISRFQP